MTPGQIDQLLAEIDRLRHLPPGWDGHVAPPIRPDLIGSAREFVGLYGDKFTQPPRVVPMTRGRLQFEWTVDGRELEVEFPVPGIIHYLGHEPGYDDDEDIYSSDNRPGILQLFRWLFPDREVPA